MDLVWIDSHDALTLHGRMIAVFGGLAGVRDGALLESALARPRQLYSYADSPEIIEIATAYTGGIVRNHPSIDGNKRTGFLVGILFLELNGYRFDASEETAARAVLDLASGALDEPGYSSFLRAHCKANSTTAT